MRCSLGSVDYYFQYLNANHSEGAVCKTSRRRCRIKTVEFLAKEHPSIEKWAGIFSETVNSTNWGLSDSIIYNSCLQVERGRGTQTLNWFKLTAHISFYIIWAVSLLDIFNFGTWVYGLIFQSILLKQ